MNRRAVAITGLGLLTPLGRNVEENWAGVEALRTGIAPHAEEGLPNAFQYFGRVAPYEVPDIVPPKLRGEMRFINRGALLGFLAACEAVGHSGVKLPDVPPGHRALYIASGDMTKVGYDFMYPAIREGADPEWEKIDYEKLNEATLHKINPFFLLESIQNNLFSFLSAYFEFRGPNSSLASLSPYGGQALELAARCIQGHRADIALAVGYGNWITDVPRYELEGLGLLSKCKAGAQSFRPFDRRRDGFIPGEGAAALFLEAAEVASRRGANVLGRIRGMGSGIELSPGQGMSVPPGVNRRSIRLALENACVEIADLAFICAHGSATQEGDRSELQSILDVMDTRNVNVPTCGMKPYTGHMGAASDLAEIVLGIRAVRRRVAPATLNFGRAEKEFSRLNISACHQPCEKATFLSLSYGLGGQSSSVIIAAS